MSGSRLVNMIAHPTTFSKVKGARLERDEKWNTAKRRTSNFDVDAEQFESAMHHADELADTHLSNVEDAVELQSRIHELEKERQTQVSLEQQVETAKSQLHAFDGAWGETISSAGLADMSLEDASDWIRRRNGVLLAADALSDARIDYASTLKLFGEVAQDLSDALRENGVVDHAGGNLAALCVRAEQLTSESDGTHARRETLNAQLLAAQRAHALLEGGVSEARREIDRWNAEWASALSDAGLDASYDTGTVEGGHDE